VTQDLPALVARLARVVTRGSVDRLAQQVLGARRDQRAIRAIQGELDRLDAPDPQVPPVIRARLEKQAQRVRKVARDQLVILDRQVTRDLRAIADSLARLGTQDLPEIVERLGSPDLRVLQESLARRGSRGTQAKPDPQDSED
jgi:hypothetical protein